MKELSLDELRKVQLDMLSYFDAFCEKHDIKYSVGEGTLIGAIRHKGFIPWDDDVDILMVREEFDKFLSLYKSENEMYPLLVPAPDNEYWWPFPKLIDPRTKVEFTNGLEWPNGVWLTVFPIDNIPDDEKELKRYGKKIRKVGHWCYVKQYKRIGRTLASTVFRYFVATYCPFHKLGKRLARTISKTKGANTLRRGLACILYYREQPIMCPTSVFDEYIDVDFENLKLKAFKGYDAYLRAEYGDWTVLPPEDERVFKHDYRAYWR